MADAGRIIAQGTDVLVRDGAFLDERRFSEWLQLYTEDCEFWVPTWRSDEQLAESPHAELSHLYFHGRGGLEDRVHRVQSGLSPASTPMPRTCHIVGNVLPVEEPSEDCMKLRASWHCDVFFVRGNLSRSFFGSSQIELRRCGAHWRIHRKRVVLLNDYIPTMLDFYCL